MRDRQVILEEIAAVADTLVMEHGCNANIAASTNKAMCELLKELRCVELSRDFWPVVHQFDVRCRIELTDLRARLRQARHTVALADVPREWLDELLAELQGMGDIVLLSADDPADRQRLEGGAVAVAGEKRHMLYVSARHIARCPTCRTQPWTVRQ